MARVQYRWPSANIDIMKTYVIPKQVTKIEAWWKAARRAIPEIPDVFVGSPRMLNSASGWMYTHHTADIKWIKFDLESASGEKAYVVIDRQGSALK